MNRIEKEVVEAEFENWLLDETHKCERVGVMLSEDDRKEKKEVEDWMRGYCGDCEAALGIIREGRVGLI